MKRLTPCLLGIALAAWGTACTTSKGTEPDPVPSGPPPPPVRWAGMATFTENVQHDTGNWTNRFEVQVTWVKVENPSPAPPPGTTRYVPSGSVHVFMQSYSDIGRCTVDREGQFPVAPTAVALLPDEQRLDLAADGRYQGKLYGSWQLDYLQVCRDGVAFQSRTTLYMELDIAGALDGGRMHGDMQPKVLSNSSLTSTRAGSWNFTSN
jgi:hypothetical protein